MHALVVRNGASALRLLVLLLSFGSAASAQSTEEGESPREELPSEEPSLTAPHPSPKADGGEEQDDAGETAAPPRAQDEAREAAPFENSKAEPQPPENDSKEKPPAALPPAEEESTPKKEGTPSEEEAPRTKSPYEGLDQTGTPPLPEEEEQLPRGEWDDRYDGRRKKRRAEDALIWIPRAPLLPAHLVLNYGVRWPIVTSIAKAEEVRFFHRVQDVFTWADGDAGAFPIGFFDKGRGLWGGGHFFYENLGRRGHSVRATAGFGTNRWILASATDSLTVFDGETGRLSTSASYVRDPTLAFTGLGPETNIGSQTFFTEERAGAALRLDVDLEGLNRFATGLSYKHARLLEAGRRPDIDGSSFDPAFTNTAGFDDWFDLATLDMRLELDTRSDDREFFPGSGFRVEAWGAYNVGSAEATLSYFKYGTRPGVFWDISGKNHVLSASAHLEALSKTGGGGPPLSETVSLGGSDVLKAFLPGRFRGQSALVYSLAYSWPVLAYADALVFSDLGTAYLGFFEDFSHDKMVVDWGTGLRTSFSRDLRVELLFAWGSNRAQLWNDRFQVDNFRFVAGVGRGF